MNAPLKTTLQVSLLFLMLYQTAELRFLLGKPQPRLYLTLSAWALAFGCLSSIPLAVAFFTGRLTRLDYVSGGLLLLCATVTVCHRLFVLHRPVSIADTEEMRKTAGTAEDLECAENDAPESPSCDEKQDTEDQT